MERTTNLKTCKVELIKALEVYNKESNQPGKVKNVKGHFLSGLFSIFA